ncbi:uncharacterized protein LOC114525161 isoform X1 [Dendronephthya gigantea]|uniref:uncharacterized protein LOC114525161 isoform X1 n=1 Tax=Dendronephthya gigantea TaxID=151771 RepID=UPI00106A9BD6|nr:uncharacterized protein LOC114525161 isoform X1 [Dendronephthya gigantea]XP_028402184.1 uncharacterized protein LOC114525161 isoform X1 [Dendronephthya gigantea]
MRHPSFFHIEGIKVVCSTSLDQFCSDLKEELEETKSEERRLDKSVEKMKFCFAALVVFVVLLSPSVYGAESDVPRVFDENLQLTEEEMEEYMKQVDLEKYGFKRTEETTIETDENGEKRTKRTIYYKVTDDCSRAMFWEGVLEQRLPEKLKNLRILSTTVREVQNRIAGRKTKQCTVGLEIHPDRNRKSSGSKRSMAGNCWWWC